MVVVAVLFGLLSAAPPSGALGEAAKAPRPPKPVVSKIKPTSGPVAGGTKVVVKGQNLTGAKKVLFGKVKGKELTVKSAKKLTVVAPAQAEGQVHVRVVTTGGKSKSTAADFFTYLALPPPPPPPPPPATPPSVTGVTPGSGTTAGGTLVTVSGTDLTGATSVTFGGLAATGLTPVSATTLQVTSPAHAAGPVDVRVTTPAGVSPVVAAGTFSYVEPAPAVTAVAPTSGPTTGDTEVTVTGTDFTGATSVTFGDVEGTDLAVTSDTSLTVVSPAHGTGVVDVRVETADGTSAVVAADQFTYVPVESEPRAYAAPLPGDADEDPGAVLNAVSCPEEQACFAVGSYRERRAAGATRRAAHG